MNRYFVIESVRPNGAKVYRRVMIDKNEKECLQYAREQATRFHRKPEVADVRIFEATEEEYAALKGRG